jgi:hypothetical protein
MPPAACYGPAAHQQGGNPMLYAIVIVILVALLALCVYNLNANS